MAKIPDGMKTYGTAHLRAALEVMREACDEAERAINDADRTDIDKAARVLHAFAWGWANASARVETTLAHVDRWMVRDGD